MQRGYYDTIAEILEEITHNPHLAPSRITSRAGISYNKLQPLLQTELIKLESITKKRRKLTITAKGKEFLSHYRTLKQIMPQT